MAASSLLAGVFARRSRLVGLAAGASTLLSACVSPVAGPGGNYTQPIGDAPVTPNPTPYSAALVCLSQYAQHYGVRAPRIAVGRIADYTGKAEDNGGREVTQGASLMAISALAKAGAPLVERYDTSVSELELKYANNKLISDTPEAQGAQSPDAPQAYRKIMAGQVPGSDFYLVGGITELNYNIRSSGIDAQGGKQDATKGTGIATGQLYVMNVALDLRLVETKTMEVVDVVSYQKQIVGRQVGLGLFKVLRQQRHRRLGGRGRAGADPARRTLADRARHGGDGGQPIRRAGTGRLHLLGVRPARAADHHRPDGRLLPRLQQPGSEQCRDP